MPNQYSCVQHDAFPVYFTELVDLLSRVAAVLTAKGLFAAAIYRVRLRISSARRVFPVLYNGPRDVPQTKYCPFPWKDLGPTCFFGPVRVQHTPNAILVDSAVWGALGRDHDGLSRRGSPRHRCDLRWANRPMREAHGLPQTSQVHVIVPLAATGSFLAFRLATRPAVRLSSKADMAFEQHCIQTLLSRGAVRNTKGARSHARRLILRLSL